MSRHLVTVVGLAVAFALMSLVLPWWSVVLVAAMFGARTGKAWPAAIAALLGWGALLAVAAVQGQVGVLAGRLGVLFHLPGAALIAITLLFAAVLAWSSAAVGALLNRLR